MLGIRDKLNSIQAKRLYQASLLSPSSPLCSSSHDQDHQDQSPLGSPSRANVVGTHKDFSPEAGAPVGEGSQDWGEAVLRSRAKELKARLSQLMSATLHARGSGGNEWAEEGNDVDDETEAELDDLESLLASVSACVCVCVCVCMRVRA